MEKDIASRIENISILDRFFKNFDFAEDRQKVIVTKVACSLSIDFSTLRMLNGIKEIEIRCPGDLYSDGDMLLYRSNGQVVLAFCFAAEKDVVVPDGVNVIGPYAFDASDVRSVSLPQSLVRISEGSFGRCTSLLNITIPKNLTEIGDYAFQRCTSLKSIKLPEHLIRLGYCAFSECRSLESITVPESLKELPDGVFIQCSSLAEVKLPQELKTINQYAFSRCTSLKSINLPATVYIIGDLAFANCKSLTQINLPEGLISIGQLAFSDCRLKEVTLPSSLMDIQKRCFAGIQLIHTQHFHANLVMAVAEFPGPANINSGTDSFCIDLQGKKFVFPRTMSQRGMKDANSYLEANAKKNSGSVHSVHNVGFTGRARHQAALCAYKMSHDAIIAYPGSPCDNLRQYLEDHGIDMVEEAEGEEEMVSLLRDFQEIGISREMVEKALEISGEKGWACSAAFALKVSRKTQQKSFSL